MAITERFEIELPADLASFVHAQIGSEAPTPDKLGEYMRALVRREQEQAQGYADTIRQKITEGMRSVRAGEGVDGEGFMARLDSELAEQEGKGR